MEALIRIQKELKAPKGQFNKFGGYNYRSLEDIMEAVKPLLQGAFFTLSYDVVPIADRVYVKATATLTEGEKSVSVTAWARETDSRKGMDAAQVTGSAISYAGKYAASSLFMCADSQGDPDSLPAENAPSEDSKWMPTSGPGQQPAAAPPQQPAPLTPPPAAAEGQTAAPTPDQRKWLQMLWDFYLTQANERPMNVNPGMHKMLSLCMIHMQRYPGSMNDVEQLKAWIKVEELIG